MGVCGFKGLLVKRVFEIFEELKWRVVKENDCFEVFYMIIERGGGMNW